MAEPFTIYKLTILYMLDKAGFPLSNTQISNFFLEKEYTDHFRVPTITGQLTANMQYVVRCAQRAPPSST